MTHREATLSSCSGSRECEAEVHIHGCFADEGNCDEPDEHLMPGWGKFIGYLERPKS